MPYKDLSNQRFGRLIVLRQNFEIKKQNTYWICQCDCGKQCSVAEGNLVRGKQISCGCYKKKVVSAKLGKIAKQTSCISGKGYLAKQFKKEANKNNRLGIRGVCPEPNGMYKAYMRFKGKLLLSKGLTLENAILKLKEFEQRAKAGLWPGNNS